MNGVQSEPFGTVLKRHRQRVRLTQEELAERAGLSVRGLKYLEQGARQPYRDTVQRLVAALALSPAEQAAFEAAARLPGTAEAEDWSAPALRHNLPEALTSFVGREEEQAQVRALLAAHRLVTLVGPGGAGKTRLALTVAGALLHGGGEAALAHPRFPDGVWLVGLAAIGDPSLVGAEVASALDVREEPGRPLPATIAEYLKRRSLLLVLDNCEHLIDACARLATALLAAASVLRILATSQEPLGVAGEQVFRVSPLPVPDPGSALSGAALDGYAAVQLFVERARSCKHDFALNDQNAQAVAAICARLDGMPLAIELAAARLNALTVEAIASRLDDRFRLLTGGPRTALPRQKTLRAALDWSYDLLDKPERVLLRRLSVFAGGCTLEAAETVCGVDGIERQDVLDLLAALVDKSLVQTVEALDGPRYRLLETVRQYGAERREEAGEATALHSRLLDWSVALAEEAEPTLRGPEQARWLARLETELDNMRAALGWSMSDPARAREGLALAGLLDNYWLMRGHYSEGRRWLEQGLATAQTPDPGVLARAAVAAGKLAHNMGDYAAARAHYETALTMQKRRGDEAGAADTLRRLGLLARRQGRSDEAVALYRQSLELATALRDRWAMAAAHNSLGMVADERGDAEEAARQYHAALAIFREEQDQWSVASVLNNLGVLAREQGERADAANYYTEALAIRRALDDKPGIAVTCNNLGVVAFDGGEYVKAQTVHEESLALGRAIGDWAVIVESRHNLARALLAQGETRGAARCFRENLLLDDASGDRVSLASTLEEVAKTLSTAGDRRGAATLLGAASTLRNEMNVPLSPRDSVAHEQLISDVRSAIGDEQYAVAWQTGAGLNAAAAAALARERLDGAPDGAGA